MADEEHECPPCPAGIPAWVMTFADLMSLLMCFFVLLLSFSQIDAIKVKRLAGMLSEAFGVQREVQASDPPKGTSVIARHFSPAIPEPTPINEVRQKTSDITKNSLEVQCQDAITAQDEAQGNEGKQSRDVVVPQDSAEEKKTQEQAMKLAEELEADITSGKVEIETVGKKIVIRIQQRGAFRSGSDYIEDKFLPVIDRIRTVLVSVPGRISVEGHTDNIPLKGGKFKSNWTLSSARAAAFAEELFVAPEMDENRFQVVGHGSQRPLANNDTFEGRERNRRVELIILRSQGDDDDDEPEIKTDDDRVKDAVNAKPEDFELAPTEIF